MNQPSRRPKLFALLIGIDEYQLPVTPLNGCANDVNKWYTYLRGEEETFDVLIEKITNQKATKAAIVSSFKNHLHRAEKEDTVLFYYSGHGTQEEADEVFWKTDPDKKLETLVCYDSITNKSSKINLLADKELRFLISELAASKPHIITIFDCCHSGSNTRNGSFSTERSEILERRVVNRSRMSQAFPKREWDEFIFSQEVSYQEARDADLNRIFPEGEHIQFAACQNDESAYEVNGEGVFTKNLLDILQRCNGNISYHRLQSTIRNYLRHQFSQTPKLYNVGNNDRIFSCFLNKEFKENPLTGAVSYNNDLGWILDMGSMQGIVSDAKIDLTDEFTGKHFPAKIKSVNVSYSVISFSLKNGTVPAETSVLKAEISDFATYGLQIYVDPAIEAELNQALFSEKIERLKGLHLISEITDADYCLIKIEDNIILSRPEKKSTPIVPPIPLASFGSEQVNLVLNYFSHLSQFSFVKNLTNANSFILQPKVVSLEVFTEENISKPAPINADELILNYKKIGTKWSGSLRIKLKNKSERKLYCAICYLSFNFGVYTRVLPAGVEGLEPGAEAWAMDGAPIDFILEPEVIEFGYKESISFLKFLVSTEDFTQQLNTMDLKDLPGPLSKAKTRTRGLEISREPGAIHDWTSRLISLRMPNPEL